MKIVLKLEEAAMFIACIFALSWLQAAWWVYLLILVAPDISFVGYAGGNVTGALTYNLFHHKGIAIAIFIVGMILKNEPAQITGIILFGHSSLDRMLGYGLKSTQGFSHTHLGTIGTKKR